MTIISRSPLSQLAEGAPASNRADLLAHLRRLNIRIIAERDVKEINDKGLVFIDEESRISLLEVENVVIARGSVADNELAKLIIGVSEIHSIGDCVAPRDIAAAIYEGALVGRRI